MKKRRAAVARYKQIGETVAVVIADRRAKAVTVAFHARFFRYIFKCAVRFLMKQKRG